MPPLLLAKDKRKQEKLQASRPPGNRSKRWISFALEMMFAGKKQSPFIRAIYKGCYSCQFVACCIVTRVKISKIVSNGEKKNAFTEGPDVRIHF